MLAFQDADRIVRKMSKSPLLTSFVARATIFDVLAHIARAPALGPQPFQPMPNITVGCMDEVVRFFHQEVGWGHVRCQVDNGKPMMRFDREFPRLHVTAQRLH